METSAEGFLTEPVVTFDREEDRNGDDLLSAYVELRPGIKAVRSVQPNPEVLVYFLIAADGLPVGFSVHEPVNGVAVCEIVNTLIGGPEGPEGVDSTAQHHFITTGELRVVVRGMQKSIEGLLRV